MARAEHMVFLIAGKFLWAVDIPNILLQVGTPVLPISGAFKNPFLWHLKRGSQCRSVCGSCSQGCVLWKVPWLCFAAGSSVSSALLLLFHSRGMSQAMLKAAACSPGLPEVLQIIRRSCHFCSRSHCWRLAKPFPMPCPSHLRKQLSTWSFYFIDPLAQSLGC